MTRESRSRSSLRSWQESVRRNHDLIDKDLIELQKALQRRASTLTLTERRAYLDWMRGPDGPYGRRILPRFTEVRGLNDRIIRWAENYFEEAQTYVRSLETADRRRRSWRRTPSTTRDSQGGARLPFERGRGRREGPPSRFAADGAIRLHLDPERVRVRKCEQHDARRLSQVQSACRTARAKRFVAIDLAVRRYLAEIAVHPAARARREAVESHAQPGNGRARRDHWLGGLDIVVHEREEGIGL